MTEQDGNGARKCPNCHKPIDLKFTLKVTATPHAIIPNGGQPRRDLHSQTFRCPCCLHRLNLTYQITGIVRSDDLPARPASHAASLKISRPFHAWEKELIDKFESSGLMRVFGEVVEDQTQVPNRPQHELWHYLVNFLRDLQKQLLPPALMKELESKHPRGRIEFYRAHHIGMITLNGQVLRFLPAEAIQRFRGKKSRDRRINGVAFNSGVTEHDVTYICRTVRGYVPRDSPIFLEALMQSVPSHRNGSARMETVRS